MDWRAPISSLYYDSEVGHVSYLAPSGMMHGDLSLKRQIVVEDEKLISFTDSDLMTNDELLKPYLNQESDKRLKSIIATIQSEQNKIIRAPRRNMIVQGVAGSGKTTVALHRLSYLIYQMKKFDSTSDFLIIGPNKLFLNYISSVLPELDTGNSSQFTFEEIAKEVVDEKFKILNRNDVLKNVSNNIPAPAYLKTKTSLKYKQLLDEFLNDVDKYMLPEKLTYKGIEVFSRDEIYDFYCAMKSGHIQSDYNRLTSYIVSRFNDPQKLDDLLSRVESRAKVENKEFTLSDRWKLREMFEKGNPAVFKNQISLKKVSILKLYTSFINYLNDNDLCSKDLCQTTLQNIDENKYEFEDLAALIYLKQQISPCTKFNNICHIIVDEAQDLGAFHYVALKELFDVGTFDLFGDLNQAIYAFSSIDNWDVIANAIFQGDCRYLELVKSYRTTTEIMDAANLIGNSINLIQGVPVIRHGDEVRVKNYTKSDYSTILIENVIEEVKKYKNVAILCKNSKECQIVAKTLSSKGIKNQILQSNSSIKGVVISTIQESKGLEFESVIINNASEQNFCCNNTVDMKLLYVAITRGMHNVKILSDGEVSEPLKSLQTEANIKKNSSLKENIREL